MADILLYDTEHRFGYADDLCICRTGHSLEDNAIRLGQDLEQILGWGAANKVSFDPEKSELMHFTRAKQVDHFPEVSAPEFQLTIRQCAEPAIRWLGVWFDGRLKFREHVTKRVAQADKIVRHIRNLANTRHGPNPSALRKAVITCVLPVLTYGSEAWYAGMTKSRTNTKTYQANEVSTRQHGLVNEIGRVLNGAARAILPVWRTTPTPTLYRDAGLPPAQIALDKARLNFSIRLRAVDQNHPLVHRISRRKVRAGKKHGELQQPRTRLQHAALLLPDFPRPRFPQNRAGTTSGGPPAYGSKADEAKAFRKWQNQLPDTHIVVFSDGSKLTTDAVGWGFAIYRGRRKIDQGRGRLGIAEVFDGEVEGALQGLRQALRICSSQPIHVCLDNTAVIQGLQGDASESSQAAFLEFQDYAAIANVEVRWVPGHQGIEGNEEADRLAKEGASLPLDPSRPPTLAGVRHLARTRVRDQFSSWWDQQLPKLKRYRRFGITTANLTCPAELNLPRRTLHSLLAARSGHGDFEWYHRWLGHTDDRKCTCGKMKTPDHPVHCKKTQKLRSQWPKLDPEPRTNNEYWLRLMARPKDFATFLQVTRFYEEICP
jgi:ribonuclease HI